MASGFLCLPRPPGTLWLLGDGLLRFSSLRGCLLSLLAEAERAENAGSLELVLDTSDTIQAGDALERMFAHQMATTYVLAMKVAAFMGQQLDIADQTMGAAKQAACVEAAWMAECTVVDISVSGARLQVPGSVTVPDQFELSTDLSGSSRRCRTVWCEHGQVGVEFVDWA